MVKLNRRAFVTGMAFAGGSALGVMLSPAPWYLVRDLAFWTQNWPWVPVPEPGEPSFERSVCRICDGGCGLRVRKIDSRLVRIDGDEHHPVNRGSICPTATAELQHLYGSARIETPLRQVGTRNKPEWKRVSWNEAIDEVSGKVRELRSAEKSHALACIACNSNSTVNELFERFLKAVGSGNFMRMSSGHDARRIVLGLMQGIFRNPAYDLENARCILSFGSDLFNGWGTTGRMFRAHADWFADTEHPKVEIVQIEPNLSITAAKASRWVPIKPGSEAALALGIAHVLIKNSLYDKEFVRRHCFGFEDWQHSDGRTYRGFKSEILARYSPRAVERMTNVPAKDIEELAFRFAMEKPAVAVGGQADGSLFTGLYELMAIHSLNALAGNINRKGGVLVEPEVPVGSLSPVRMDEEAIRGFSMARLDESRSETYPFTDFLPNNLNARDVEILFIHEANPLYALPDRKTAKDIFEKVPYIVTFASHMSESAALADLVLPVPTAFERWDDQIGVPGLQYPVYTLSHPLVPPLFKTRNAGDFLIEVAQAVGGAVAESFPWHSLVEVLRERARGLFETGQGVINTPEIMATLRDKRFPVAVEPGKYESFTVFWSHLVENSCWFDPAYKHGDPESALKTPDRKFEFFSRTLRSTLRLTEDIRCMPHYNEPPPNPRGFDFTVMPVNLITMGENGLPTPPLLIKQLSDDVLQDKEISVQINPITAMYKNLKDGDTVLLETSLGRVRVKLRTFAGVREGVALIPLGFGHTAYDEFLRNKGVNAHHILEARKDDISGLPVWWATPGRIIKV